MSEQITFFPDFSKVESNYEKGVGSLLWTRRIDDIETPISALAKLGESRFGSCLFESVEGGETRGRYSIVAVWPDRVFKIEDDIAKIAEIDESGKQSPYQILKGNPLDAFRSFLSESQIDFPANLPPPLAGVYGYLAYETIRYFEKIPKNTSDPLGLPQSIMTRPLLVIVFDGVKQELLIGTPIRPKKGSDVNNEYQEAVNRIKKACAILNGPTPLKAPKSSEISTELPVAKANQSPEEFMAKVKKCQEYIVAGDIFQVVPSQRFTIPFNESPMALYRALRRTNPSPFLFMLQMDGFSIVGSSPEILVRLRDGTVTIRPIAGTRARGTTPAQDKALEEELLNDPKERSEHLMLLDLGRNDVGRVSVSRPSNPNENDPKSSGGVRVTSKFFVERYSHVMHIVSNVEGTIKPGLDAIDALYAGFPAGTVSGAPKIRAMEIINELEPHERGVYAGGVGYFSAGGDMDLCIALRTGIIKDKELHIQAGAGVVLDSVPESEHLECVNKAKALLYAANEAKRYNGDEQ